MVRLWMSVPKMFLAAAFALVLQACNTSDADLQEVLGINSNATTATTTTTTTTVNGPLGNSALSFAPPFYAFATLTANSGSATNSFVVKNTSTYSIYIGTISGATADFTLTANTCTNNLLLVQNATCTFTVQFTPLQSGSLGAVFNIPYDLTQGVNAYSSSISVTGSGTTLTSFSGITAITTVTPISAKLHWTDIAGVGTYQTYKIVGGSPVLLGNVTPAAACVAGACTYSATGLLSSTAYTFRVRATDTFGIQELNIVNLSTTTMVGVLKLTGATTAVAGACASVTVTIQDGLNNPINMGVDTTIAIAGLANGALFSDAGCTASLANPVILTGTSALTFYFKDTVAQTATLTAALASLTGDSRAIVISADVADHLVYVAGNIQSAVPQALLAVNPKVQVVDRYNNPVSGVALAFLTERGGGFCTSNSYVTSDAQGYALVSFKNGPYDLKNTIRVKRVGTELPDLAVSGNKNYLFTQTVSAAANSAVNGFQQRLVSGGTDIRNADFNGDGKKDLVVANYATHIISVYLAQSNGTFTTATTYTTGLNPYTLAVGDLNADTKPDIVVVNISSASVSVFLNTGTGTFSPKADYAVGASPYGVVVYDMTGDGKLDIVTSNYVGNSITVLTNNGGASPSFLTPVAPATYATALSPRQLTAGDFNGDGKPDVAVAISEAGAVSVFYGTGAAGSYTLLPKADTAIGSTPWDILTGDINNDGRPDLVLTQYPSNTISVLLGQGTAGSYTFAAAVNYAASGSMLRGTLIDINADGFLDLIAVNYLGNTVIAYLNNGAGGFPTTASYVVSGGNAYGETVFDADGDGKLDIFYVMYSGGNGFVGMLKGRGVGLFYTHELSFGGVSYGLKAADLNADGKMDVVASGNAVGAIEIFKGNGDGSFQSKTTVATGINPREFQFGDFNQDGKIDIIALNYGGSSMSVLRGNGDGTFQAKTDTVTAGTPAQLAVADFNKDGKLDVAVVTYTSLKIQIFFGDGTGAFGAPTDILTGTGQTYGIAAGDIDNDGDIDIVAGIYNAATINVYKNNGAGVFGAATAYVAGVNVYEMRLADVNADGALDLITAVYTSSVISVYLNSNNGDGLFNPKVDYGGISYPVDVQAADVTGDGVLDLISADYGSARSGIFQGTGTGTFQAVKSHVVYDGTFSSYNVAVADFNNDGKMDIVINGGGAAKAVLFFGW